MRNPWPPCLLIASCLSFTACSPAPTKPPLIEYRVEIVAFKYEGPDGLPPTGLQDYLNKMSAEGWELAQFVEHENWYRVVVRRPKPRT